MSHAPVIVRNNKLNDDSPRMPQSSLKYEPRPDSNWTCLSGLEMRPKMWAHQLTALYAMRTVENDPVRSAIKLPNGEIADMLFRYKVGVLCDPPGAGKTAVIAANLAFHDLPESRQDVPCGSVMRGLVTCYPAAPIALDKCSLVVVSHNIVAQWRKTFENIGMRKDVDFKIVHKVTETVCDDSDDGDDDDAKADKADEGAKRKRKRVQLMTGVIEDALSGRYRILLVSNTAYQKIIDLRPDLPIRVSFQRVIIDEADTISISNFVLMPSRFLWLVTATADCFQIDSKANKEDRGCLRELAHLMKVPADFKTGSSYERIRHAYRRNVQALHYAAKEFAFVHCEEEEYIHANQGIPKPTMTKMTGNTKLHRLVAHDLINRSTQTALETGSFLAAEGDCWRNPLISLTNPFSREREVKTNQVEFLNSERICALTLQTMDPEADAGDILKLPCCKANVNRRALARVKLVVNSEEEGDDTKGPACRHGDISGVNLSGVEPMDASEMRDIFNSMSVFADVARVIKQHEGKRVLVFVSANTKKDDMVSSLKNLFGITASKLQGSQEAVERLIDEFRHKKKCVLLIGDGQGQGINLEMADVMVFMHTMTNDRFKQMVGRGQRPGRSDSLLVYHMQA
jgi:soluble P-type ATPase